MNEQEILTKRKAALASALMQFHPELLTAITSDKGAAEIADAINALIEFHCLVLRMDIAGGTGQRT